MGTNWTNMTSFENLLSEANAHSPFWTLMLFMIWAVLTITFMTYGTMTALIAGSFLAGLIGIFLVYMGLVSWKWVLGMFALVVLIVIFETLNAKKEK